MRLKLTLARPAEAPDSDVLVTLDTTVTVGALAAALAERDPQAQGRSAADVTLRVDGADGHVLPGDATVADAGLRSGHSVTIVPASGGRPEVREGGAATLVVLAGPDEGKQFELQSGTSQIGRARGNDVRLTDPQVSKSHARINITEVAEIVDLGSSNGTLIGGDPVPRAVLRPDDHVQLGDTVLRVVHQGRAPRTTMAVDYNRSPRLDVVYPGVCLPAPEVPKLQRWNRIPVIPLIAPVVFGLLMFAITQQLVTVLFVALSPVMLLGNVIESRWFGRKDLEAATETFRQELTQLGSDLAAAAGEEAAARRREHPATEEVVGAALRREPLLWSCRPDQRGFLELRLGLGALESRNEIELPTRGDAVRGLWAELLEVRDQYLAVDGVPVVASLIDCGSLGVAGPRASALPVLRALVAQLCSLHSPAEVVLAAIASTRTEADWAWLKWLPHVTSDHSPLASSHLAASPGAATRLVSELEDLVAARRERDGEHLPAVVLVVEDDAPVERSRLVELAEDGRGVGVHLLWLGVTVAGLPAACRTFVEADANDDGRGTVGYVDGGRLVEGITTERMAADECLQLARSLAPVIDAGARIDDASDLPRSVSLVSLLDTELMEAADAVVDRWRTSNSLPADYAGRRRKKDNHIRASVGMAAGQNLTLDLREHGPHALVGGTTGSGKSEFLQSWVMAMALEHSPARVTFLFVDYKGGSAFSECVELPHSVGLVTDLSPHLVRRALTSLNAELRHREHILQQKRAKDLLELERRGDPEAPPSLVIVVDEFAALVKEVPEFVDGVVNVAQRGRSLGLHLILATQRPAGVIKDNLRANTNLRVALRMADEDDSDDVVGSKAAAAFDPGAPGRGIVKVGPGRLTPFQSGYVGGWTSDTPPPPVLTIEDLRFGAGETWEALSGEGEEPAPTGPNDLQRLVGTVRAANTQAALPKPRRPWLDTLADAYDLARAPQSRTDSQLVFGIVDDPEHQRQDATAFHPDRDGNMVVYGTGGTGKSGFLRALAIVAGLGIRGGPCHVYGLDFGARGLQMLEPLPHVGSIIQGEDDERIQRLLRQLRQLVDERAAQYADVDAGSIEEYRKRADQPDEPRILLLVDNMAAFRQAYEIGPHMRWFETFQSIAAEGRPVGVHVVISADRTGAVPSALASVIQRRLVLRLASENEYLSLGVAADVLADSSPPGRGIISDEREVQVTVLGGSSSTARQAQAIKKLAEDLEATGRAPAPEIERLTEVVTLGDLPTEVDGHPALGIADEDLEPMGFVPEDVLLIVGPPQSGKTSTMATIAMSLKRSRSGDCAYLGAGRSPLRSVVEWNESAVGEDEVTELARKLADRIGRRNGVAGVFVEDISSFVNTAAESALLDLIKACRGNGVLFATDGETSAMASWPLQMAVRAARHGIALQPDQPDGDVIFKTSFPRVARADFPAGRGLYVRSGLTHRVQVALPEVDLA